MILKKLKIFPQPLLPLLQGWNSTFNISENFYIYNMTKHLKLMGFAWHSEILQNKKMNKN